MRMHGGLSTGGKFFTASNHMRAGVGGWARKMGRAMGDFGRFHDKQALVHLRGSYLEVGLGSIRSANSLF